LLPDGRLFLRETRNLSPAIVVRVSGTWSPRSGIKPPPSGRLLGRRPDAANGPIVDEPPVDRRTRRSDADKAVGARGRAGFEKRMRSRSRTWSSVVGAGRASVQLSAGSTSKHGSPRLGKVDPEGRVLAIDPDPGRSAETTDNNGQVHRQNELRQQQNGNTSGRADRARGRGNQKLRDFRTPRPR